MNIDQHKEKQNYTKTIQKRGYSNSQKNILVISAGCWHKQEKQHHKGQVRVFYFGQCKSRYTARAQYLMLALPESDATRALTGNAGEVSRGRLLFSKVEV